MKKKKVENLFKIPIMSLKGVGVAQRGGGGNLDRGGLIVTGAEHFFEYDLKNGI